MLRTGQGVKRANEVPRGGLLMTDDNTKPPQSTYQHDRDLQRRGVKMDDAIRGITDDDRKMIINKSLRKANSALSVS
jgi:hypothetical protein